MEESSSAIISGGQAKINVFGFFFHSIGQFEVAPLEEKKIKKH